MRTGVISIWIIEDDEDDRALITEAFSESFMQVVTLSFDSAVTAIEYLKNSIEFPRIIVTDFNMPKMNGYEFINQLHQENKYEQIKKVVLSTCCLPEDQQKCLEKGAHAFITKPSSYGELVNITKKIIALLNIDC